MKKIVVTGATGNIGSKLITLLAEKGHQVIAVGRNMQKLQELHQTGVTLEAGDLADTVFLTSVFTGADALFSMIPPNFTAPDNLAYQRQIGESITQAVKDSGVKYIVNLSSSGAELAEGTGPIMGVRMQEQRLNALTNKNILHLRPVFFMENHLANVPMIQHMHLVGSPLKPEIAIPMIATADIATVAAKYLDELAFTNITTHELLGPREYTMPEVTQMIGRAIGQPDLPYVPFSYEDTYQGMVQNGMSPSLAGLYIEFYKSINERKIMANIQRTANITTPTTFEQFAQVFKQLFSQETTLK